MRSMRERRGRSRGSCDEVKEGTGRFARAARSLQLYSPPYESRSPPGTSKHAGWPLGLMERATNRLRRIIMPALAAVVWKHHRLRLSPALSLLEEDLGRPPS